MDVPADQAELVAPPDVIAFDLLETLFPIAPLQPLLVTAGGDGSTLALWFSRLFADGFALAAAGEFKPFKDLAKATLHDVLPKAKAAARDKVVAGLAKLDPHPDAAPAMGRAALDARVIVVANGSTDATEKLLARGGLDTFVEEIVSADDVRAWKPRPEPYLRAAGVARVNPEALAMVTAHPWDVLGADRAGLVTGWTKRGGGAFPAMFPRPDVTATNLLDVVEGLFALKP